MESPSRSSVAGMHLLTKVMIRTFFRDIAVEHADRVPLEGPVLLVANHNNGLVDGLLLMATMPRWPRFLAKATLVRIVPLRPFLRMGGVISVHRAQDADVTDAARGVANDEVFSECRRLLAAAAFVAIFPEGVSHDETALQPLRTGASRIALGARFDAGADGLVIVPVGLAYDAKATFRSRAIVTVGEPIGLGPWEGAYATDPRAAARDVTDAVAAALVDLVPDGASHSIAAAPTRFRVSDVVAILRSGGPGARVVEPRQRWALRIAAPIAALGALVHAPAYLVIGRIARLPKNDSIRSTVKLFGCTALFSVEWAALGIATWRRLGVRAAAAAVVVAPLSGYVTVRFTESLRDR